MNADKYKSTFGKVLKEKRLKKGLSQEKLALDCDLDRTFISLLERGLRQPSLSTIVKIANQLNILPSKLLRDTEKRLS